MAWCQWRTSSAPLEGKFGAPLACLFLVVDYQRWLVLRNGSASKNAKLLIGRAYGKAIGSYCVKPIHDLSAADPFSKMMQLAMFEFGRCNLWTWTLQYLWYLLFWTISVLLSQRKQFIRVNHMPYIAHTLTWMTIFLCCLITNSSSEWTVCFISHTPSSGCPFLLFLLIANS